MRCKQSLPPSWHTVDDSQGSTMQLTVFVFAIWFTIPYSLRPCLSRSIGHTCVFLPLGYPCKAHYECKPHHLSETGHTNGPWPGWKPPPGSYPPPSWTRSIPMKTLVDVKRPLVIRNVPLGHCSVLETGERDQGDESIHFMACLLTVQYPIRGSCFF